jgi:hypothetical protein
MVEQLLGYIIANKDNILEATAPYLHMWTQSAGDATDVTNVPALGCYEISDHTRVFFDGLSRDIEIGDYSTNVQLWVEGQFGESIDCFWEQWPSEEELLTEE